MNGNEVRPVVPLRVAPDTTIGIPGSKSLTNRTLVCAALADGTSVIEDALVSEDTEAMAGCLGAIGSPVTRAGTRLSVEGAGARWRCGTVIDLHAGLSGTTARFVLPLLALGSGSYRLDGYDQLRRRPMGEMIEALRCLGADVVEEGEPGHLPVLVDASAALHGGDLHVGAGISSQFVSGLLMAAPYYPDGLRLHLDGDIVSRPFLDMTIAVMAMFGVEVTRSGQRSFTVPSTRYTPAEGIRIEPDASAASYFLSAAALTGGRVRVEGLGTDSLQGDTNFADVLGQMGASVKRGERFVEVRGTGILSGIDIDLGDMPDMATTLAAVAVFARTPTRVRNVAIIKGHETDRIAAMDIELRRAGIVVDRHDDGWTIHPGLPRPTRFATYDDHRMAMSLSLLGLLVPGIEISDPGCVAKTFPSFFETLDQLR